MLVPGDANSVWNQSAQQYYQRETGNLKSFQQQPRFQVPVSVLDIRLETLAWRDELQWRKEEFNLYDKKFAPALGEPPNTSSSRKKCGANSLNLRCLFEQLVVSSGGEKKTAKVSRNVIERQRSAIRV